MATAEEVKVMMLKYRMKNNLTQEQFAKESGISFATLSNLVTGKKQLKPMTLLRIEEYIKERENK